MAKSPGKERRRLRRVQVELPVAVHAGNPAREAVGMVFNLSEGGAFLRMAQPVELGAPIRVAFAEGAPRPAELRGKVARVEDSHGVGVEFSDVDTDLRNFVRRLMGACRDIQDKVGGTE